MNGHVSSLILAICLVVATVLAVAVPAGGQPRRDLQHCSGSVHVKHFGTATRIRVHNVGCNHAKRAIKGPATKYGYNCPMGEPHKGGTLVRCYKGSKYIKFLLS